jgi:hypothetical protein
VFNYCQYHIITKRKSEALWLHQQEHIKHGALKSRHEKSQEGIGIIVTGLLYKL